MKEKSCGAIVYKKEDNRLLFLLVHQSNSHYSFPKGHMEDNETEVQTALREIKEETNLDVEIDTNFRYPIMYLMEKKNVYKEAVYFVAIPTSYELKNQEGEISECAFYSYNEVLEKLEFDNIKEVFKKAYEYINSKEFSNL